MKRPAKNGVEAGYLLMVAVGLEPTNGAPFLGANSADKLPSAERNDKGPRLGRWISNGEPKMS
jgi:hypothetical protein